MDNVHTSHLSQTVYAILEKRENDGDDDGYDDIYDDTFLQQANRPEHDVVNQTQNPLSLDFWKRKVNKNLLESDVNKFASIVTDQFNSVASD